MRVYSFTFIIGSVAVNQTVGGGCHELTVQGKEGGLFLGLFEEACLGARFKSYRSNKKHCDSKANHILLVNWIIQILLCFHASILAVSFAKKGEQKHSFAALLAAFTSLDSLCDYKYHRHLVYFMVNQQETESHNYLINLMIIMTVIIYNSNSLLCKYGVKYLIVITYLISYQIIQI